MKKMHSKFVGRQKEIRELEKCYNSGKSEFVAVYGRRRVGKTFLIRNVFANNFFFYTSGVINGTMKEELNVFYRSLKESGYEGSSPKTWMEAFDSLWLLLEKARKKERCTLFIDEISSLDTKGSGFLKALDYFWNTKASMQDNVLLIISGSATHWIINKVINDKGGLHNRVTKQIHLRPFTLKEVEEYGEKRNCPWTRLHYVQLYSAIGGIPFYWDKVDFTISVDENMDNMFFSKDGEMAREYQILYRSLFKNPEPYISIIKALAATKEGLDRTELEEKTKIGSGSRLTQFLLDLENCDFISHFCKNGKKNGSIYRLTDFYTIFYMHFSENMNKDGMYWRRNMLSPKVNTWRGLSFELICMTHSEQLLSALHLDTINTNVYTWRKKGGSNGAQIDIVIDRADNMFTLFEVKYTKGQYHLTKDEYMKIVRRMDLFCEDIKDKRKGIQMVLVTTNGTTPSQYDGVFNRSLTADDLFL